MDKKLNLQKINLSHIIYTIHKGMIQNRFSRVVNVAPAHLNACQVVEIGAGSVWPKIEIFRFTQLTFCRLKIELAIILKNT